MPLTRLALECVDAIDQTTADYSNITSSNGLSGNCEIIKTGVPSNVDLSGINCGGGGMIVITYTVTDNCGNTYPNVVCNQTVNAAAVPAQPACPTLAALECVDAIDQTTADYSNITSSNGLSGNCEIIKTGVPSNVDLSGINCGGGGMIVITYTVTDNCGNTYPNVVCNQTVNAAAVPAQPACPTLAALECVDAIDQTTADYSNITSSNGLSGNCEIIKTGVPSNVDLSGINCGGGGMIVITYTVTDNCGNTYPNVVCNQTVNAAAPATLTCPSLSPVNCEDLATYVPPKAMYTNNESGACLIQGELDGTVIEEQSDCGILVVEYVGQDECGNTLTTIQCTTNIIDNLSPTLNCPPMINTDCDITGVPPYMNLEDFLNAGGMASDNCALDTPSFTMINEVSDMQSCPETVTRTYRIFDKCGNPETCTQDIVIDDNTPPTITPGVNLIQAFGPNVQHRDKLTIYCPEKIDFDFDVITDDNCGLKNGFPKYKEITDGCEGDCTNKGYLKKVRYRWIAKDNCDNKTVFWVEIILKDTTKPEITALPESGSFLCDQGLPMGMPQAVDEDCAECPQVPATLTEYAHDTTWNVGGACYKIVRKFRATDACGNSVTAKQVIKVFDNDAPLIQPDPNGPLAGVQNGDIVDHYCGAPPPPASAMQITDCHTTTTNFLEALVAIGNCPQDGYLKIYKCTWQAYDPCGNFEEFFFYMRVIDTVPPNILNIPTAPLVICTGQSIAETLNPQPIGDDACDDSPSLSYELEFMGMTMPIPANYQFMEPGQYTIHIICEDHCENRSQGSFTLIVIACPNPNGAENPDQQQLYSKDFRLYPNPTQHEVTVDLSNYVGQAITLEMYSQASGQIVKHVQIEEVSRNPFNWNIADLVSGEYFVRIRNRSGEVLHGKSLIVIE